MTDIRPISSSLSIFYTRAKHTFFSNKSQYYLNLPPSTFKPLLHPVINSRADSPHPDPDVFKRIEEDVKAILASSLRTFVRASFSNVSAYRAICGILGGGFIIIITGLIPLLLAIFLNSSRWLRLIALPGLIVGLTIIITSFHGLCLGIYFFGDARQLHNFELARPAISRPAVMATKPIMDTIPHPGTQATYPVMQQLPRGLTLNASRISVSSAQSDPSPVSKKSSPESSSVFDVADGIYISPAMDPETGEYADGERSPYDTAAFIKPYAEEEEEVKVNHQPEEPNEKYKLEADHFDFNGLPNLPSDPRTDRRKSLAQSYISTEKARDLPIQSSHIPAPMELERGDAPARTESEDNESEQGRLGYATVPPFGPLTRILSPVVTRAHREILFRSIIISSAICLGAMAGFVAIPPVSMMHRS